VLPDTVEQLVDEEAPGQEGEQSPHWPLIWVPNKVAVEHQGLKPPHVVQLVYTLPSCLNGKTHGDPTTFPPLVTQAVVADVVVVVVVGVVAGAVVVGRLQVRVGEFMGTNADVGGPHSRPAQHFPTRLSQPWP